MNALILFAVFAMFAGVLIAGIVLGDGTPAHSKAMADHIEKTSKKFR